MFTLSEVEMKEIMAISIFQPWASLIGLGYKQFETRGWKTEYRGKLLICAGKKKINKLKDITDNLVLNYNLKDCSLFDLSVFHLGKAVAIVELTDCIKMTEELINSQSKLELEIGNWQIGKFAWKLTNVELIEPFTVIGQQKLFKVKLDTEVKKLTGKEIEL